MATFSTSPAWQAAWRLMAAASLAAGIAMGWVSPAAACSDLPNICDYERHVFEQNQVLAREAAEAAAQDYEDRHTPPPEDEGPPPRDPMDIQMDAMAGAVLALHSAVSEEIERMRRDPELGPIVRGKWEFFQDTNIAAPGEYCAALYTNIAGFVRLSGPGGDYRGALLTFWGPDIPKPERTRRIRVTLVQVEDNNPATTSTQTVQAFNYTESRAHELGVIALAVPSADALLSSVTDHLDFRLEIDGQVVQQMGFHSGHMARDRLAQCIAAAPARPAR